MTERAFQDRFQSNLCWGCGAENHQGLRLKSFWSGEEAVSTFEPSPHHAAGPPHVLNGGIIATLIDCHSICTAIADAYRREGREIGTGELIWYVTATLEVTYVRPTPIDKPVTLKAHVREHHGKKAWVDCTVLSGGVECARGKVLAIRVSEEWRSPSAD